MAEMKYGAIALLDRLGTKGIWQESSINEIIEFWYDIENYIKSGLFRLENLEIPKIDLNFKVFTFSDTIIIILNVEKQEPFYLIYMGYIIGDIFSYALEKDILFRGAISLGKYYTEENKNIIIGPAIDDVAEWYDKPDWAGVHLTPSTSFALDYLSTEYNIDEPFCVYDIPIKNRIGKDDKLKGWTINWPALYINKTKRTQTELTKEIDNKKTDTEVIIYYINKKFSKKPIFKEYISKYQNTIEFVKFAIETYKKSQSNSFEKR